MLGGQERSGLGSGWASSSDLRTVMTALSEEKKYNLRDLEMLRVRRIKIRVNKQVWLATEGPYVHVKYCLPPNSHTRAHS